ncbi:MAG: protein O-mannosyl-transferase family [Nitriliruptorales bacterium]
MTSSAEALPAAGTRSAGLTRPRSAYRQWRFGLLALIVVLAVLYAATLLRDVGYGTDTAKFQYLGRVLGTAHQPGYPLFTMLLALVVRVVPFGSDALRVDLMSAAFGVTTCALLFLALLELEVRRVVAFAASLLVGVTQTFWTQAIAIEVYSLHSLFAAAVLLLLLRWQGSRQDRHLVLALAVYALSFSHTTASILLAPGIGCFIASVDWRAPLRGRVLRWLPLFALLAVGPYAYIVWRSLDPSASYLEVQIRSVADLIRAIRATNYTSLMFSFGPRALLTERLPMLHRLLVTEPLLWALPLALVGAVRMRLRPVNLLLAAWAAMVTLWGLEYSIGDVFVYFTLTYVVVVLWGALGFDWLLELLMDRASRPALRGAGVLLPALSLLAPVLVVWSNYPVVDLSRDETGRQIRSALQAMPEGGVVFTYLHHHFNYELVGQDRQEELGVYARDRRPYELIARYCQGAPIEFSGVVGLIPPGLPVYAYGADTVSLLRNQGFAVVPTFAELARIDCGRLPSRYLGQPA